MKNAIHDMNNLSAEILKFARAFEETGNRHVAKRLSDFHATTDRIYHELVNIQRGSLGRAGYVARLLSAVSALYRFLPVEAVNAVAAKIGEVWFFELKTLKQSDALHEGMVQKFWDDAVDLWPGTFHKAEAVWNETVNPPDKIRHSKWDNVTVRIQPQNAVEVIQLWVVAEEPKENAGPILG